jgi:hypothetical protein
MLNTSCNIRQTNQLMNQLHPRAGPSAAICVPRDASREFSQQFGIVIASQNWQSRISLSFSRKNCSREPRVGTQVPGRPTHTNCRFRYTLSATWATSNDAFHCLRRNSKRGLWSRQTSIICACLATVPPTLSRLLRKPRHPYSYDSYANSELVYAWHIPRHTSEKALVASPVND